MDGGPDAPAAEVGGAVDLVDAADGPGDGPRDVTCAQVRALADRGLLTPRRTHQALFTRALGGLVLKVAGDTPVEGGYIPDDLMFVRLADGAVSTLARGVSAVEWLGSTGDLLVTSALTGTLSIVSTSSGETRALGGSACDHVAAPDGSRVFVTAGCDLTRNPKPIDEIDVRTGAVTRIAPRAAYRSLAVSPGGGHAAYVAVPAAADAGASISAGVVHVVDRAHRDVALDSVAGASDPAFASDEVLLFQQGRTASTAGDIYRFRPGADATPALVVKGRHPGPGGYRVAAGAATLLAARFTATSPSPDELYAVRLDGSGETLLASDLAGYQLEAGGRSAFAFTRDGGRAVYVNDGWRATSSVAPGGGAATRLGAAASFAVSPFADRIALVESSAAADRYSLRVVSAAGDREAARYDSTNILGAVTFVAGDRGFLFVEHPTSTSVELWYLSFASGVARLGRWTQSALTPVPFLVIGEMRAGYPVDPTGCYTVVDSDAPGAVGTRLVVLPE
jgi:hypothetical protein